MDSVRVELGTRIAVNFSALDYGCDAAGLYQMQEGSTAIGKARRNGFMETVALLLADPRVRGYSEGDLEYFVHE